MLQTSQPVPFQVAWPYELHEGDQHEHDDQGHEDVANMPLDENHPMWKTERIELHSVGIDIGSSTSHLMFSKLVLRRMGLTLSSKFVVVQREVTYRSPILLTPYSTGTTIDTAILEEFIDQSYRDARVKPSQIDTGAVIVTGEAAKKENARAISSMFAEHAGKFVCATAGPNLESILAAHGSGAVLLSQKGEKPSTVMNVDLGGGTCKVAVVYGGRILETTAINVGARLVAMDRDHHIARLEEAGRWVGEEIGLKLKVGDKLGNAEKTEMARVLSRCLFEVVERRAYSALTQRLMICDPLTHQGRVDAYLFSGGVSEYVYGLESRDFGDLGNEFAAEIRARVGRASVPMWVERSAERIRATVIGASQYTVQVSGSTIFLSKNGILPLRNLQVLTAHIGDDGVSREGIAQAIRSAFNRFDQSEGESPVALTFKWVHGPSYPLIRSLAEGVLAALPETRKSRIPVVLVFDTDIAKLIGNILTHELCLENDLVSIDEVELRDFDYIDIGEELPDARAVPVVVKSLVFQ
jgi:ethanolamine utilization protein EutA